MFQKHHNIKPYKLVKTKHTLPESLARRTSKTKKLITVSHRIDKLEYVCVHKGSM